MMETIKIYEVSKRPTTNTSAEVYKLMKDIKDNEQELMMLLCLDSRNRVISRNIITIGGLNSSIVHPREIFRTAIMNNANTIILVHNHPSGLSEPSPDDIEVTQMLVKASKIIGIDILDHVIVGHDNYTSMNEKELVDF